jgi:PAS domain S-box-containing protein
MSRHDTPPGQRRANPSGDPYDQTAAPLARRSGGFAYETGDLHRLLVESVHDYAIFALDPEGNILTWNAGARRLKGYEAGEIVGQHFSKFYPEEKIAQRFPQFELESAERTGRFEDEGWRIRKDGTRFWANVIITALRDDDGVLIGFAKVTRDLTERRAAQLKAVEDARALASEERARRAAEDQARMLHELADRLREQAIELETRRDEADLANRAKSAFLAAMSHELRTPLNAIGGYAELLEIGISGPLTDTQTHHVERIKRSQQHLLRVINDILNFSRVEASVLSYDIGPVPMDEVTDEVAQMIAPQAAKKGVAFHHVACPPDLLARVDKAKVQQILLNLLSNAVKFTATGGVVELACTGEGSTVRVIVRDTGMGIPANMLDDIFEPFVQVGRSLTSAHEGTGLGLAISRDLARAMGGDIAVESTPESGSTFTLRLPREDSASAA